MAVKHAYSWLYGKYLQVLTSDTVFSVPMAETYNLLGVDTKDIITLEKYLQDYFTNILKKLKDLKAQSKQSDIFFWKMICNCIQGNVVGI